MEINVAHAQPITIMNAPTAMNRDSPEVDTNNLQSLLDLEAQLSNTGHSNSEERKKIHTMIRLKRQQPAPVCFGDDDCGIGILMHCPWRIDCGPTTDTHWHNDINKS